jgi:hypothetical protein
LFGGGSGGNISGGDYTVTAFNSSLSRSSAPNLSTGRGELAATNNNNYALFGGGYASSGYSTVVDAYNSSLTRTTAPALSRNRGSLGAASVGGYALFCGGDTGYAGRYANVDAYDGSLTRTIAPELSIAKTRMGSTSIGGYALFGGGATMEGYYYYKRSDVVDVYDTSLTRTSGHLLKTARYNLAATSIGKYALFGGGSIEDWSESSTVDVYTAE